MSLEAGTRISRYEIQSLLGTGGMGEVYLARDTELHRDVAVKLLTRSEDKERLRRFRLEARTVSSFNHPNILTIHEFGQYDDFHFIVTELIKGQTLRQKISQGELHLSEALEIAIQIGAALATAHAAGIVHRDIKPENVMILPDSHVKVLDFGLAKLTNHQDYFTQNPQNSTASLLSTDPGLIVGTVNYMSPEQLRGQPVDERADIWSFGVVVFEMIARQRPFPGASVSDVIAAILERQPSPLTGIVPEIPVQLETILSKALCKDKKERYQTTLEFVGALKEARHKLQIEAILGQSKDNPETRASTQSTFLKSKESPEQLSTAAGKTRTGTFARRKISYWISVGLPLLVLLLPLGVWFALSKNLFNQTVARQMRMRHLTTTNDVMNAVISPDGRFFVYVQIEAGQQSLWLRQVNAASGQELIPPGNGSYSGLTFAPDGNSIYFSVFGLKENTTSGTLFRIPILGGSQQELIANVDSPVTFAPDGKRFAFIRKYPEEALDRLMIANLDGTNVRMLSERKRPDFYAITTRESPSWSPDGKMISCPAGRIGGDNEFMGVVTIDTETGREIFLTSQKWWRVGRTLWLKDGSGLIITASDFGTDLYQIFRLSYPDGEVSKITTELNDYSNLSLTENSNLMLAVVSDKSSTIFTTAREDSGHTSQLASGKYDGFWGLGWTPRGDIIYVSLESGNRDIWVRSSDNKNPAKQLTFDAAADDYPTVSPDGLYIVFVSNRTGAPHLWRMNSNGGELKQLTNEGGESFPQITSDGQWVIYSVRTERRPSLWKVSVAGGTAVQLTNKLTDWPSLSPDGKWIACLTKEDSIEEPIQLAVLSTGDASFSKTFAIPEGTVSPVVPPVIRWLPNSQAIAYVVTDKGISNIWEQPLSGGAPKKLTDFTADRIFGFDWSKDGKRLVYSRGVLRNDVVLLESF
jgi:serine/threonine protein kinase